MNYITIKHKVFTRYKNMSLINGLFALFGKEIKPQKWVFIVGCYNSGTTLLSEILEKHAALSVLPDEGVMLTNQLPRPEDFGWRRMWCQCEKEMQIPQGNASRAAQIIKKHWSHFVKKNPEIVVEKSIANTTRMLFFQEHFPNSYFIHIVRNGYAVAEGIQRKALVMEENQLRFGQYYPMELPAQQWQRSIDIVAQDQAKIHNFLEITYEELTGDLEATALKITDFIGIQSFDSRLLQGDFEVHGKKMKVSDQNQKSLDKLGEEEWQILNEIAAEGLKKYSYFLEKNNNNNNQ